MTLRRIFFWLHLSVGLIAGLLIGFLALTGSIIAFQPQLIAFAERSIHANHPAATVCVPPSTLLSNAAIAAGPGRPLTSLTLFADPRRPAQIALGRIQIALGQIQTATAPTQSPDPDGAVLLADACTGRILGPGASRLRVFLTTVRELHHQAAFHGTRLASLRFGKNAATLAFVFLTLSGLFLWFPRQLTWQHLRPSLLFRPSLRGRAREWNLHTLAGFWLCLPLFAIATTGTIMAFPWANNLLSRAAGDTPPPPPHRDAPPQPMPSKEATPSQHHHPTSAPADYTSLDAPIAHALSFAPGVVSTSLRLPAARALAPTLAFQLARNESGQSMNRDQLTLATADASVLKWDPFATTTRSRRWRVAARYLHTGELFGAPGQAIALLSTLGALLLVWTGFSLALRRLAAFRHRHRHRRNQASATDRATLTNPAIRVS